MAKTKAERWNEIHQEALDEFDEIQASCYPVRMDCLQDRRFCDIPGAQWEGDLGEQFENKPKFEVNKVQLAVFRVINEYRNNRITVDFTPKDGDKDDTADLCDGLYRADERDSSAQEAYDNAFEEAVKGGMGAYRLVACYENDEDDEDDRQRIRMEPIFEADACVYFDLGAKKRTKADAKRCFVLSSMDRKAYEREYGDDVSTWPQSVEQRYFDWGWSADSIYIAEYYRVEEKKEVIHVFRGLTDEDMEVPESELEEDETKLTTLEAQGFREVRRKRVTRKRVHKYIMSGGKILEDCGIIAGKHIPIIPVYGKRSYIDGQERIQGHVRIAKDAQRLTNMLRSWLAEISTFSPIEKPIFTPEQMIGHQQMWADDPVSRYPYLIVNPVTDGNGQKQVAGPIGYTKPPQIPPALAALLQITEQDLQDLLGNQQAGEQMQSNISGKVVELVQNRLDMQAYIYMSNFAVGVQWGGQVWLEMQKDIIVEQKRKMKVVTKDGEVGSKEVNVPAYDPETGEEFTENDIGSAKMDVWADVGPSSSSQRQATVRAVTGLAQITEDPMARSVLTATAAMNIEGEGLQDLRDFFRKQLVRNGAVKPTDEEAKELQAEAQNQAPDPQAIFLQAEAGKSQALTRKALADTEQSMAKTAQIISETTTEGQQRAIDLANALNPPPQQNSDPQSGLQT